MKLPPFSKFAETATGSECVTEMLIFRSSRSQTFFKISILKNFAILEPLFNNKVADLLLRWLLLNVCGSIYFLIVDIVFIADSRTGFCSGLLWKRELNLRSIHWSCSVKKAFWEHFQILQENNCVSLCLIGLQTFWCATYEKETPTQMFSCETYKLFKNTWFEVCERLLLKPVLSLGLPFLVIYVLLANSPFTPIDTATIRSYCPVVLCEKGVPTNFAN